MNLNYFFYARISLNKLHLLLLVRLALQTSYLVDMNPQDSNPISLTYLAI